MFVTTLLFLLLPTICFAEEIKVELIWKFPESRWLELEVRQGGYKLNFNDEVLNLRTGEKISIGQSGLFHFLTKENQIIILDSPALKLTTFNNGIFRMREPGKDWVSYRGNLVLSKEDVFWKLLNILDSEDYLKGVVPIEMSNAWATKGFEALKAQAVAARTYLLKNMDTQNTITDSPDIHQAYWGRSVEGEASKAVEATAGEILVDSSTRQPISIFYSSHNGGHSEETQNVWENHDSHYTSEADLFSEGIGGSIDRWMFLIAADTLGQSFGLAPIREIQLKKYQSGRVFEVVLLDWLGGQKKVSGGEFVRKFYPYNQEISENSFLGRLFQIDYFFPKTDNKLLVDFPGSIQQFENSSSGPVLSRLKSSNDGLSDKPRQFGVFVFNGRGWGHGVGMSQWGAYNMAMQGYSYEEILSYYYKNSVLEKKP